MAKMKRKLIDNFVIASIVLMGFYLGIYYSTVKFENQVQVLILRSDFTALQSYLGSPANALEAQNMTIIGEYYGGNLNGTK